MEGTQVKLEIAFSWSHELIKETADPHYGTDIFNATRTELGDYALDLLRSLTYAGQGYVRVTPGSLIILTTAEYGIELMNRLESLDKRAQQARMRRVRSRA